MASYGSMNKEALRAEIDARGLDVAEDATNQQMADALKADDDAKAAQAEQTQPADGGQNQDGGETIQEAGVQGADVANRQVQQAMDEEQAQGYFGHNPDPTPNENYTLQGQIAGAPTPETDPELRAEARRRSRGEEWS